MAWKKAIEVKVVVNGTPAQEYDDDDQETIAHNTVTKYIEAISGAEFEVQFELKRSYRFPSQHLVFQISVDGRVLDNSVVSKEEFAERGQAWVGSLKGIMRSHGETWSLERFRFSEIKTSDDQAESANADLKLATAQIGTITLEVHRKTKGVLHEAGTRGSGWHWDELKELGTLPEKILKGQALTHSASLSSPQFTSPRDTWVGSEYVDGQDKPFAVFHFRYRSRRALQDLHIIPRTPTPVPLAERPIEELTLEEPRELLRQQRERQPSTVAQLKPEINPERGIKREYENDEEYDALLESARANKVRRVFAGGEIIDLSED